LDSSCLLFQISYLLLFQVIFELTLSNLFLWRSGPWRNRLYSSKFTFGEVLNKTFFSPLWQYPVSLDVGRYNVSISLSKLQWERSFWVSSIACCQQRHTKETQDRQIRCFSFAPSCHRYTEELKMGEGKMQVNLQPPGTFMKVV